MIQKDLSVETLAGALGDLLSDPGRLLAMAEAARAKAETDAVEQIAAACREVRR